MYTTLLRLAILALPFLLACPAFAQYIENEVEKPLRASPQVASANNWTARYSREQLRKQALSLNADYLGESNWRSRWRQSEIKVFVDSSPAKKLKWFNRELYELKVQQCMENWNEALDNRFRFSRTSKKTEAQITITFDTFRHHQARAKCGFTRLQPDGANGIVSSDVFVFLVDADSIAYDDCTIESTLYHEFGHALGLNHSVNRDDIMYPNAARSSLSVRDRNTVRKLYGLPVIAAE